METVVAESTHYLQIQIRDHKKHYLQIQIRDHINTNFTQTIEFPFPQSTQPTGHSHSA